jgi:hypothetical protein
MRSQRGLLSRPLRTQSMQGHTFLCYLKNKKISKEMVILFIKNVTLVFFCF